MHDETRIEIFKILDKAEVGSHLYEFCVLLNGDCMYFKIGNATVYFVNRTEDGIIVGRKAAIDLGNVKIIFDTTREDESQMLACQKTLIDVIEKSSKRAAYSSIGYRLLTIEEAKDICRLMLNDAKEQDA